MRTRFVAVALAALALLVATAAVAAPAATSDSAFTGDGPWMVRAWFGDADMIREVASWGDHYQIDRSNGSLRILADAERLARLRALGFWVELDEKGTALLRHAEQAQAEAAERAALGEAPLAGIPGFPCYRTIDETFATAAQIAAAHPTLATWVDAGDSWEKVNSGGNSGDDMSVLVLTNSGVPGPKPVLFVTSSIHAREYAPAELMTRFAEELIAGYGVDPDITWILDTEEVHLMLEANPDGRRQAEQAQLWRKNTNQNYCSPTSSSRGADLNRNFSFEWNCCGGSDSNQCGETYHGPSPASEPEVQAIEGYMDSIYPPNQRAPGFPTGGVDEATATGVYLDIHSYGELVLWPWGGTATHSDNWQAFTSLGRKYAFFNGHYPEQSIGLYPTDGTTDDYGYGALGVNAQTFEVGTDFFQDCATFENNILPGNLPALLYAAKVARTPWVTPKGPDSLSVASTPNVVAPGDPVDVTATLDDTRYSNANGTEPVQNIAAGEVYLDTPPWAGGTPVAMSPADGNFNSPVEGATATLGTSGLPDGRHLLYVRGRDAANNWGAISAAWLTVIDPAVAPIVQGNVLEAGTGTPLAATVSVGPYSTPTDPGTGAYSIQVPAGTYDLTASAVGHASATFAGVTLVNLQTLVQDFSLMPFTVVLDDDVEGGNIGWTPTGQWAITTTQSHSPTHSWTDSPAGNYGNNSNTSITSPLLDLSGVTNTQLSFWHRYDTEAGYDYCHVEVSTNGGSTWSEVASYNGSHPTWDEVTIALPQLDGVANARVRFRLSSDVSVTGDGWYVDDILVQAVTPQAPQAMSVSVVGPGTVTSNPAGISCPSDCAENFGFGTPVVLTATPDTGAAFTGWSGDCSGTGTCNLTMDAPHSVTATFVVGSPNIFDDGFESGDTSAWSVTVP
jgi:carboxypeptidase T